MLSFALRALHSVIQMTALEMALERALERALSTNNSTNGFHSHSGSFVSLNIS